jgi:hypothetical protein
MFDVMLCCMAEARAATERRIILLAGRRTAPVLGARRDAEASVAGTDGRSGSRYREQRAANHTRRLPQSERHALECRATARADASKPGRDASASGCLSSYRCFISLS